MVSINDAQHPARQKAIRILEAIAEALGQPEIFYCNENDSDAKWYVFEDLVTYIITDETG